MVSLSLLLLPSVLLEGLGLPPDFVGFIFTFHREVRLRTKLLPGFGTAWNRDGGISHGGTLRPC